MVGGASNNEFFVKNVGEQVSGVSSMGAVYEGNQRLRGSDEAVSYLKDLRLRAIGLANHVRQEASGLATLVVDLF